MDVRELYGPSGVVADPADSLIDIASRMRFNDVGAAFVIEDGYVAGIITERDFVRAIADGAVMTRAVVGDYMTAHPTVVTPDTSATEAARIMARTGIGHLAVVEDGRFVGVISGRSVVLDLLSTRAG